MGFDWVKATAACSIECVFHTLREVVDSDVKSANALKRDGVEFIFNTDAVNKFIVIRKRDLGGITEAHSVVFELSSHEIRAKKAGHREQQIFRATPRLTSEGECRLLLDGEQELLQLWQVSQKALADLFFGF